MGGRFSILALLLLLSCCLSGEPEVVVKEKYFYVCARGDVVSDPGRCELIKPEKLEVYRFVCSDGEVVDDSRNCSKPKCVCTTTSMEETTSTSTTSYLPDTTQRIIRSTTTPSLCPTQSSSTTTTYPVSTTSSSSLPVTSTSSLASSEDDCSLLGCPPGSQFAGSKTSDKFHLCSCRYAKRIKPENILCFEDKAEAEEAGYVPCGVCSP